MSTRWAVGAALANVVVDRGVRIPELHHQFRKDVDRDTPAARRTERGVLYHAADGRIDRLASWHTRKTFWLAPRSTRPSSRRARGTCGTLPGGRCSITSWRCARWSGYTAVIGKLERREEVHAWLELFRGPARLVAGKQQG